LYHGIDNHKNTVLIVGYATPNTPAGRLRDGAKELRLFGDFKTVNADVEVMDSFSAHADKLELVEFLRNQRESAKKIFLVHGDYDTQKSFGELLLSVGFAAVEIPELGQEVTL
jgi:metallo-beta-lactamase family protein